MKNILQKLWVLIIVITLTIIYLSHEIKVDTIPKEILKENIAIISRINELRLHGMICDNKWVKRTRPILMNKKLISMSIEKTNDMVKNDAFGMSGSGNPKTDVSYQKDKTFLKSLLDKYEMDYGIASMKIYKHNHNAYDYLFKNNGLTCEEITNTKFATIGLSTQNTGTEFITTIILVK